MVNDALIAVHAAMLSAWAHLEGVLLSSEAEGVASNDKANLRQSLNQTAINSPLNAWKWDTSDAYKTRDTARTVHTLHSYCCSVERTHPCKCCREEPIIQLYDQFYDCGCCYELQYKILQWFPCTPSIHASELLLRSTFKCSLIKSHSLWWLISQCLKWVWFGAYVWNTSPQPSPLRQRVAWLPVVCWAWSPRPSGLPAGRFQCQQWPCSHHCSMGLYCHQWQY